MRSLLKVAFAEKIFFSAGNRDSIAGGNVFTVYDNNDMRLGEIKVRQAQDVEFEQTAASFKDDPNGALLKSVRQGDAVKIFFKGAPQ